MVPSSAPPVPGAEPYWREVVTSRLYAFFIS